LISHPRESGDRSADRDRSEIIEAEKRGINGKFSAIVRKCISRGRNDGKKPPPVDDFFGENLAVHDIIIIIVTQTSERHHYNIGIGRLLPLPWVTVDPKSGTGTRSDAQTLFVSRRYTKLYRHVPRMFISVPSRKHDRTANRDVKQ